MYSCFLTSPWRLPFTSPAPAAGAVSVVARELVAMASSAPTPKLSGVGSKQGQDPDSGIALQGVAVADAGLFPEAPLTQMSRDGRWAGPRRFVLIPLLLK